MKTKWLILPVLGALVFTLNSCKDEDSEETQGTSPVMVRMTDSPGEYEEVNINIQEVWIHADNGGGWTSLNVNKGMYNLLDYSGGLDTLIASADIPSGRISQVRLVLGDGNSVKVNGILFPLATPSAQESGLKIQIHAELIKDVPYTLLLDFDAAKSIVQTGAGAYKLKPVLRTVITILNGGISGTVSPASAHAAVMAIINTDTMGTYTDSMGNFMIKGLAAGTYKLWIDTNLPYKDTTINNVVVVTGQINSVGVIDVGP